MLFKVNGRYVDNQDSDNLPEWKKLITARNVTWHTVCSCMYANPSLNNLNFKRRLLAVTFGGVPQLTSQVSHRGTVHRDSVGWFSLLLYTLIVKGLPGHESGLCSSGTLSYHVDGCGSGQAHFSRQRVRPSRGRHHSCDRHTGGDKHGPAHTSQCLPDSSIITSDEAIATNSSEQGGSREPVAAEAYPTDSKERRKIMEKDAKEPGTPFEVMKQKKPVENHFDDFGEDLFSMKFEEDALATLFLLTLKLTLILCPLLRKFPS